MNIKNLTFLKKYERQDIIFYILLTFSLMLRVFTAIDIPFYHDELVVNAKGFYPFKNIYLYSLKHAYHPPLFYYIQYFINSAGHLSEFFYRMVSLSFFLFISLYSYLYSKRDGRLKYLPYLLLISSYLYCYSILNTNYILSTMFMIVFITQLLREDLRDNKKKFPSLLIQGLCFLTFFSNYLAGLLALLILCVHGLQRNKKSTLNFMFLQFLIIVLVSLIYKMTNVQTLTCIILSYLITFLISFSFKKHFLFKRYIPIHLIFIWALLKALSLLEQTPSTFKEQTMSHGWMQFIPYIATLLLPLFLLLISKKKPSSLFKGDNQSLKSIFLGTSFYIFIFLIFTLIEYSVHMRYLIFSLVPIFTLTSVLYQNEKTKIIIISLTFFTIINYIPRLNQISYLGLQDSRSMYEKIVENTQHSSHLIIESNRLEWHEYYLKEFKIRDHFNFQHYDHSCRDKEDINKLLGLTKRNTIIASYGRECTQLSKIILEACHRFNSKCYDLKAKDSLVILKIFEPNAQKERVRELNALYPRNSN